MDIAFASKTGLAFETDSGWRVTPSYGLSAIYLHTPDYTESGAGTANLAVNALNAWTLTQSIGTKISHPFTLGSALFVPHKSKPPGSTIMCRRMACHRRLLLCRNMTGMWTIPRIPIVRYWERL